MVPHGAGRMCCWWWCLRCGGYCYGSNRPVVNGVCVVAVVAADATNQVVSVLLSCCGYPCCDNKSNILCHFVLPQVFVEAMSHQSVPHDGVEGSGVYMREVFRGKLPCGLKRGVHVP